MPDNHVSLRGEKYEAFEDAAEMVREDLNDSDLSDAEVIRVLADAYRGLL